MKNLLRNMFKKNKAVTASLVSLIVVSTAAAGLSALLLSETFSSIKQFYQKAAPPHFLQMHKGTLNQDKLDSWMNNQEELTYHQNIQTIAVDGADVLFGKPIQSMRDLHIDVSLVAQNPKRDLLLDQKHQVVNLKGNEIGMPILLKNKYHFKVGDTVYLRVDDKLQPYKIKTFILDSMMNSEMVSSTRVLLSDQSFENLKGKIGEPEYLIEGYFKSTGEANNFKTKYFEADQPASGPTITYQMILLLSGFTDLAMVFVTGLMSILMMLISMLCLRFAILNTLEEDIKVIGTLKAIGFDNQSLRNLYINKYRVITLIGIVIGCILAIAMSPLVTRHIRETFGSEQISPVTYVLMLVLMVIIYGAVMLFVRRLLSRIKRLSIVDAIVTEQGFNKKKVQRSKHKQSIFNKGIAAIPALSRYYLMKYKKSWLVITLVSMFATIMILIPVNLYNTFKDDDFITYMGHAKEDILIETSDGEKVHDHYNKVQALLPKIDGIKSYSSSKVVRLMTKNKDDEQMSIDITTGNQAGQGLKYLEGRAPESDDEIALSYQNSSEMNKQIGDDVTVIDKGQPIQLKVIGIYQDLTSGGYTSKAVREFETQPSKYGFSILVNDPKQTKTIVEQLKKDLPNQLTIKPMDEMSQQTVGSIAAQIGKAVPWIAVAGLSVFTIIASLYLKLRLTHQKQETTIMKAIGFTFKDLYQIWSIQSLSAALVGIVFGIVLTELIGSPMISAILGIAGLGIKQINLTSNPLIYILLTIVMLVLIAIATYYNLKPERHLKTRPS